MLPRAIRLSCGLLLAVLMSTSQAMIGELVTIDTNFSQVKTPATLWLQVRNLQNGNSVPMQVDLHRKQQSAVMQTHAVDYRIERAWLQFTNGRVQTLTCISSRRILSKQAVHLQLAGRLSPAQVQCRAKVFHAAPITQTRAQLESMQTRIRQLGASQKKVPAATLDSPEGRFYASLRKCQPGVYNINVVDPFLGKAAPAVVSIRGLNQGYCLLSKQLFDISPEGADVVDAVCQYSQQTLKQFTPEFTAELAKGPAAYDSPEGAKLKQTLCQSCVVKRGQQKVSCR